MKGLQTILKELRDAIRRNAPVAGPGIRVTPQSGGTVVSAVPVEATAAAAAAEAGGGVPVAITAVVSVADPYIKYTVSVYGDGYYDDDGLAQTATETGKTLYVLADLETALDVGTRLIATQFGEHYESDPLGPIRECGEA